MLQKMGCVCLTAWAMACLGASVAGAEAVLHEVANAEELQAAVASMPAGDGGAILLRPGVYILDNTLRLEGMNHVTIRGEGWNTVLRKRGDGDLLVLKDCGFCVVRDLRIEQEAGTTGSGIRYEGQSSSCRIEHCRITGFAESGVRYDGDPQRPMSSNTVEACHLIDNRGAQLQSLSNNDFYILENQFGAHNAKPEFGCVLNHSSAGTYSLNYHWGNTVALAMLPGSHFNRINTNRFEQSRREGIRIGAPDATEPCMLNILNGNTIHTNGEFTIGEVDAVVAWYAVDTTFTSNQIFSWNSDQTRHRHGLVLDERCQGWTIDDNIIRHSTEEAVVVKGEGHTVE